MESESLETCTGILTGYSCVSSLNTSDEKEADQTLLAAGDRAEAVQLHELSCPMYRTLISNVCTELSRQDIPFETVKRELQSLSGGITIPPHVTDVRSLCNLLHKMKLCHENDVDLLCELFKTIKQDKLMEIVCNFIKQIEQSELVQQCDPPQQIVSAEHYFLMVTVHNGYTIATLKFERVFKIKGCISELLSIQRHNFTLVGSQHSPLSLVWQFPNSLLMHTKSELQRSSVQSSLKSNKHKFSEVKLKTDGDSVSWEVVFSQSLHRCDNNGTSACVQKSVVAFSTLAEQESHGSVYSEARRPKNIDHITTVVAVPEQAPALQWIPFQESAATNCPVQTSISAVEDSVEEPSVIVGSNCLMSYDCERATGSGAMNLFSVFHCPCGNCSLESYLKDGCPQSNFPLLELGGLDDDDRKDLVQQLCEETTKIIDSFHELVDHTCKSLKTRGINVRELTRRILELEAYNSPKLQKPLLLDDKKELMESKSVEDTFITLQRHMSFFNYEPLEHIIKGVQTGSEEDCKNMERYSEKFQSFCRRRVFEVHPHAIGKRSISSRGVRRKTFAVIMSEKEPASLQRLKEHIMKIATILGLKHSTLFLHQIDKGCLILVLSVPSFVAKELFPLKPEVEATLRESGYVLFTVQETEELDQECMPMKNGKESMKCRELLQADFKKLVLRVSHYFKSNEMMLKEIQLEVCSIKEFFSIVDLTKLEQAESADEIIDILEKYWDFINYSLLKLVIEKCGNEELQKKLSDYIIALENSPLTTPLVTKENPPPNFSLVVTDFHFNVGTTYDHKMFDESYWQMIQEAWNLERMKLRLEKVDLEAGTVTLSFPCQYVPSLLDLLKPQQKITVLSIDGVSIEDYVKFIEDKPHSLLKAADRGLIGVVKIMLTLDRALIEERDEEGNTALMLAAKSGHINTIRVFTEAGANVNDQNHEMKTPLMLAVINKHSDVVKYLLFEANADANLTKRPDHFTALKWAAQYGLIEILSYLIEAGADINEHIMGWTALMSAAWYGTPEAVRVLVQNGAIVNLQDFEGMTALMWAARKDVQSEALKELVFAGADLNIQTKQGKTALMLAAECGCKRNVSYLLDTINNQVITEDKTEKKIKRANMISLDIRDNKGETAILKAAIEGHQHIVEKLRIAGADDQQLRSSKNFKRGFALNEEIQFGYHDEVHGTNIEISSENCTSAHRKDEYVSDNNITYSALPLRGTSEFEVEVVDTELGKGSMTIGVIRVAKGAWPEREVVRIFRGFANSCVWNTGKSYNTLKSVTDNHSYGYKDLSSLQEGDRVGLHLSLNYHDGALSFFVNGRHQGLAAKGVYDEMFDLYAIVEHTGGCSGTRITRAVVHEPNLQDLCLKVIVMSLIDENEIETLPLPEQFRQKIREDSAFHELFVSK